MTTIRLPAKPESLEKLIEVISGFAETKGFTRGKIGEIELVIEEVLVNISNYAYPECAGEVEIRFHLKNETTLILEILDHGIPFDPFSLSEPSISADLSDRKVGGLGVFFIREVADSIAYRRDGEVNVLTLTFSK
jgi:anti-sigma regulatory factor (Ser/Thr protein kinase)